MAVETNKSNQEVINSIKYYQGTGLFKVVAINPDKEQAINIGVNLRNEPEYTGIQMGDVVNNKIVFFVQSVDIPNLITRVEFLVRPEHRVSQGGKPQFINKYGRTAYADSLEALKSSEKMSWYSSDSARPAYYGEEDLINFIRAWANVAGDGEVSLETMDVIAKGNVTELRKIAAAISDNQVKLMLGVKVSDDGKIYQQVYNKWFGRQYIKSLSTLVKALGGEYGSFKATYDETTIGELTEFDGVPNPTTTEASGGTEDDDNPFA